MDKDTIPQLEQVLEGTDVKPSRLFDTWFKTFVSECQKKGIGIEAKIDREEDYECLGLKFSAVDDVIILIPTELLEETDISDERWRDTRLVLEDVLDEQEMDGDDYWNIRDAYLFADHGLVTQGIISRQEAVDHLDLNQRIRSALHRWAQNRIHELPPDLENKILDCPDSGYLLSLADSCIREKIGFSAKTDRYGNVEFKIGDNKVELREDSRNLDEFIDRVRNLAKNDETLAKALNRTDSYRENYNHMKADQACKYRQAGINEKDIAWFEKISDASEKSGLFFDFNKTTEGYSFMIMNGNMEFLPEDIKDSSLRFIIMNYFRTNDDKDIRSLFNYIDNISKGEALREKCDAVKQHLLSYPNGDVMGDWVDAIYRACRQAEIAPDFSCSDNVALAMEIDHFTMDIRDYEMKRYSSRVEDIRKIKESAVNRLLNGIGYHDQKMLQTMRDTFAKAEMLQRNTYISRLKESPLVDRSMLDWISMVMEEADKAKVFFHLSRQQISREGRIGIRLCMGNAEFSMPYKLFHNSDMESRKEIMMPIIRGNVDRESKIAVMNVFEKANERFKEKHGDGKTQEKRKIVIHRKSDVAPKAAPAVKRNRVPSWSMTDYYDRRS